MTFDVLKKRRLCQLEIQSNCDNRVPNTNKESDSAIMGFFIQVLHCRFEFGLRLDKNESNELSCKRVSFLLLIVKFAWVHISVNAILFMEQCGCISLQIVKHRCVNWIAIIESHRFIRVRG